MHLLNKKCPTNARSAPSGTSSARNRASLPRSRKVAHTLTDAACSHRGHDNAPVKSLLSNEGIPKGISRVLNAASIREDWRKKRKAEAEEGPAVKRRRKEGGGKGGQERDDKKDANMKILPGESLAHFNR